MGDRMKKLLSLIAVVIVSVGALQAETVPVTNESRAVEGGWSTIGIKLSDSDQFTNIPAHQKGALKKVYVTYSPGNPLYIKTLFDEKIYQIDRERATEKPVKIIVHGVFTYGTVVSTSYSPVTSIMLDALYVTINYKKGREVWRLDPQQSLAFKRVE
jgi:hypothetical protein